MNDPVSLALLTESLIIVVAALASVVALVALNIFRHT